MLNSKHCQNCWWKPQGSCKFSLELRQLQDTYQVNHTVCWAWRPATKEKKNQYLERYGREVDRIGRAPFLQS